MPAARKVQSSGGYRPGRPGVTASSRPSTGRQNSFYVAISASAHADEVNRAVLDFIGHLGPAGQDGIVRHGPGSPR